MNKALTSLGRHIKKHFRERRKLKCHDEHNETRIGDVVRVHFDRKHSKTNPFTPNFGYKPLWQIKHTPANTPLKYSKSVNYPFFSQTNSNLTPLPQFLPKLPKIPLSFCTQPLNFLITNPITLKRRHFSSAVAYGADRHIQLEFYDTLSEGGGNRFHLNDEVYGFEHADQFPPSDVNSLHDGYNNFGFSDRYNDYEAYGGEFYDDQGLETILDDTQQHRHSVVELKEGTDFIWETSPELIFKESCMESVLEQAKALPLMTIWPTKFVEQTGPDSIDDIAKTNSGNLNIDGDASAQTTILTTPVSKKKTTFADGAITATLDQFRLQQKLTRELNKAVENTPAIELLENFDVIISTLISTISQSSDGDLYQDSLLLDKNGNKKKYLIQFSAFDSLTHTQYSQLQSRLSQSAQFITFLQKQQGITSIIAFQAITLDLIIQNNAVPAATFIKHLHSFTTDNTHNHNLPLILSALAQRAFQKQRYGLVNAIDVVGISTNIAPTFSDLIRQYTAESQYGDDIIDGQGNINSIDDIKAGSVLMFKEKARLKNPNVKMHESSSSSIPPMDADSISPLITRLSPTAPGYNNVIAHHHDGFVLPTLSGSKLAGIDFQHDLSLQHYTLTLQAINSYFQAPILTRKSHAAYGGFPESIEEIVQHGYRICSILVNPQCRIANPLVFYHNLPLVLGFYLTCQDFDKFNQLLQYFQDHMPNDYRRECYDKYNINTNITDVINARKSTKPKSQQEDILLEEIRSRDQFSIDEYALHSFAGFPNDAKKRLGRKRSQFVDTATQTIEFVLSHYFLRKDYTNVFHFINWVEQSSLVSPQKLAIYRNRLYAEADDQTFISFFSHKLMGVASRDEHIQALIKHNQTLPGSQQLRLPQRIPLAYIVHGFYNTLFTVLPTHATMSSLLSTSKDQDSSKIYPLHKKVMESNPNEVLKNAHGFSLPTAFSSFLQNLLHDSNGKVEVDKNNVANGENKSQDTTIESNFGTLSKVFVNDLNPNVIKINPLTQQRYVAMPELLTAEEVLKFHKISHKIQYQALKIRQKIEQTFPEFSQIQHYNSSYYPYIDINGQTLYLTQEIDGDVQHLLHQAQTSLETDQPQQTLSNEQIETINQQQSYNLFLQRNFKELWTKHITPPMFRILNKNEIGLLHLYSLCEPFLQASAIDIAPTAVRRPVPLDAKSSTQKAQQEAQNAAFDAIMDTLQEQHQTLSTDLNKPLWANSQKTNFEMYSSGEIRDPMILKPQYLSPVPPEQSILSQFPVLPKRNLHKNENANSSPNNTSPRDQNAKFDNAYGGNHDDIIPQTLSSQSKPTNIHQSTPSSILLDTQTKSIPYKSEADLINEVSLDPLGLMSSQSSLVVSIAVNSNLYLIRKALNSIKRRLPGLKNKSEANSVDLNAISHIFAQIQNIQLQLLDSNLVQTPYDTSDIVAMLKACGVETPPHQLDITVEKRGIPLKPLEIMGESDMEQDEMAKDYIKSTLFSKNKLLKNNNNPNETELVRNDVGTKININGHRNDIGQPLPSQLNTINLLEHDYDIKTPLENSEIEEFNTIYEKANFNPQRDSIWKSQIPGLSRIMSMFDFTFKLGSLPDRPIYYTLLQLAYQNNLPDLGIKMLNRQRLSMIPYVSPQANIVSIIALLECGKLQDARSLASKIDLQTTHGPVIVTVCRLAANFGEYSIPIYFLRALLAPINDFINGDTSFEELPQATNNFLLLTRLLHYILQILVPIPKSSESIIYKARSRVQREAVGFQLIQTPIPDIPFDTFTSLPKDYSNGVNVPTITDDGVGIKIDGKDDTVKMALELGLELQHNFNFFSWLNGPTDDDDDDADDNNALNSTTKDPVKIQRLNYLRAHLNKEGVVSRDLSRILVQFVSAAQLCNQPLAEDYLRSIIPRIDPEFDPDQNRKHHLSHHHHRNKVALLQRSGVAVTDPASNTTAIVGDRAPPKPAPRPTAGGKTSTKAMPVPPPVAGKNVSDGASYESTGAKKRGNKTGAKTGVRLTNLDFF